MLCINNTHTDPYFNLAAEEYLLKHFRQDIFMIYRDEPSVIVGKHQRVHAEVNLDFAHKHALKIARRFTGGGAVFHDFGNLNLTFIETGSNLNFDKFTQQTIRLLASLGIHAQADERRGLTVNGLKISGSAQCVQKDRVMYHATLLFCSDLASLLASLEAAPQIEQEQLDKRVYVKSVKSPVTNIAPHLIEPFDIAHFEGFIMDYFMQQKTDNESYSFTEHDLSVIGQLKENKYATQAWNYHAQVSKN